MWVLIREYSGTTFQWIPTWQGLDGFQKYLRLCALDEVSLSIGRIKAPFSHSRLTATIEHDSVLVDRGESAIVHVLTYDSLASLHESY